MPRPQSIRNVGLTALLLGLIFLAANLYLSLGTTGHSKLANVCFAFAIICNTTFAVSAVLWVLTSAWVREPERKPTMIPGPPGAGAKMMGGPMPMPGAAAADKKPPPAPR